MLETQFRKVGLGLCAIAVPFGEQRTADQCSTGPLPRLRVTKSNSHPKPEPNCFALPTDRAARTNPKAGARSQTR